MAPSSYSTAQEIWTSTLSKALFSDTSFVSKSIDMSAFANGKRVYWAESATPPRVKFNPTTADTPVNLVDILNSFDLDEIKSEPIKLDWTEEQVIAYAKRPELLNAMYKNLVQAAHWRLLFRWAPTLSAGINQNIIRTSGTPPRAAGATAATGNRNSLSYANVLAAKTLMDKRNIPVEGRCMLVTPTLHSDLMNIPQFTNFDYVADKPVTNGLIGTILGMQVFLNSKGLVYTTALAPINQNPDDTYITYAGAATDNESALIWHPDFVYKAISPNMLTRIVQTLDGDTMKMTAIMGGAKAYSTQLGIVAIVEQ